MTRSDPSSVCQVLRQGTRAHHERLEALPFFTALGAHELPLVSYVGQLRVLSILNSTLEAALADCMDERVRAVWHDDLRKVGLLEEDLAFFEPRVVLDSGPAVDAGLEMAGGFRLRAVREPVTLLGILYVFEGSSLGNHMHLPDVRETYKLEGTSGCRFYTSYGDELGRRWNRFRERMDTALAATEAVPLLDAAVEAFEGLERIYARLHPVAAEDTLRHVTRINPEAGDHPMPQDPREVEAALRASTRVWDEFPYYERRYGARGKRFSDSDTCWLATLTDLDAASLRSQVAWLRRLTASRGMPGLLLERLLTVLAEELTAAVPERASDWHKLRAAGDDLGGARQDFLSRAATTELAAAFDASVGGALAEAMPRTGELIAAAVVDECLGSAGAVPALTSYLADESAFPEAWVASVHACIADARRVCGGEEHP